VRISLAIIAGCLSTVAIAEQAPSFSDVMIQAERLSPRLSELDANIRAAQGYAQQATAWPIPSLNVEREDFGGSGVYQGSSLAQTTISINQPLDFGAQRRARIAAGDAAVTMAQARQAQSRAEFGHDLAIAYAAAEATQTRIDLLTEDLSRSREDVRSARALVEAGKEGELRAVQAEAAASAAEADLEAARADAVAALTHLSALVGVPEPYSGVQPSLLVAAHTLPASRGAGQIPAALSIVTAEAERVSAERHVTVAEKRAVAMPSFSLGHRRFEGSDAHAWVAGVSIPLPIFDRNRGGIAGARAELNAADAHLAAARLDAEAEWRVATAQASAANARLTASDQSERSAREAYRLARIGYDAGRTPLFELLSTRHALTDAQLRSLDARFARVSAEASLARLAGRIPFIE
jgi:cobalt-zinc-cadmium efflux system outer membrane protein